MSYEVKWHPKAFEYLNTLSSDISKRILNNLEQIKENPFHFLEHYEGEYYKFRIGDYRFLIDINFKGKIL